MRTSDDTTNNNPFVIRYSDLIETSSGQPSNKAPGSALSAGVASTEPMTVPRKLRVKQATYKRDLQSQRAIGDQLPVGLVLDFTNKVVINNQLYLQTKSDNSTNTSKIISYKYLEEVSTIEPMDIPRTINVRSGATKVDAHQNRRSVYKASPSPTLFDGKIYLDGELFLRAKTDSDIDNPFVIKYSELEEIKPGF